MKAKVIISTIFLLFLASMTIPFNGVPAVLAQEDVPCEVLDDVGTYFELQHFDFSVTAGTAVHIVLRVSSEMIDYFVENATEATLTQLAFENLEPMTTYYMYEDSYLSEIVFTTDVNGSYAYTQDLTQLHHVFIQKNSGTTFIGEDTILQSDIYGSVEIITGNVTLNLNGYKIIGSGSGIGINLYGREGVTVENCVVEGFWIGILLTYCDNNTIRYNTVASNSMAGIELDMSTYNVVEGNTIVSNKGGPGYGGGVFLAFSGTKYNVIKDNIISNNTCGLHTYAWVRYNDVYHNNFIDNTPYQAYSYHFMNTFDDGYPSGGNYWSDYTGADQYSGPYQNETGSDGIGDTPYMVAGPAVPPYYAEDHYPLMSFYVQPLVQYEIQVIESWDLDGGVEKSLITKLEAAIDLLDAGNTNGAIHKLQDLSKKVTNDAKHLTQEQKDYIVQTTQEMISLIG